MLENLNQMILQEAHVIIHSYGLIDILEKYGKPWFHGSYALRLMTWRDLDIYLCTDQLNQSMFFDLGKDLSFCLHPSKMHFRNELQGADTHLPKGLYWGIYARLMKQDWKIDIWAIDEEQFIQKQREFRQLESKIDEQKRKVILNLKHYLSKHPDYRKKFFSVDIYDAVFEGAKTLSDFSKWLNKNKGLSYQFEHRGC
jgi:hypothetical protein